MRLYLITPPTVEPVTLAEAKAHLALAGTSQDTLVTALIASARGHVESVTNRALLAQKWMVTLDAFPTCYADRDIRLPFGRCLAVHQIDYRDPQGVWQVMAGPTESPPGTEFEVDLYGQQSGIVRPAGTAMWPAVWSAGNAVRITATFGYGSASAALPPDLKQAVLVRVADLYDNRASAEGDADVATLMARPYAIGGFRG